MWLTKAQLKSALQRLDRAKGDETLMCPTPRVDAEGKTSAPVDQSRARRPVDGLEVTYGFHDTDYLQVDPVTLEVRCGACAGELDATVVTK